MAAKLRLLIPLLLLACAACGADQGAIDTGDAQVQPPPPAMSTGWPTALPTDAVQPWEQATAGGYAIPRSAQAITTESQFAAGVERWLDDGSAVDNGEASTLMSAAGGVSYAIYRIPLGGAEPGAVTVDANPTPGSSYYVGIAEYGRGSWEWHGPWRDNHTRLGLGTAGDYTGSAGSVYICVLAWDGAALDVAGAAAHPRAAGDTMPPPTPVAPSLTPVAGGLELRWLPVAAGDLAGYRIYHSAEWFYDGDSTGARVVAGLEGLTEHYLTGLAGETFVRISAVDTNGNESLVSEIASAVPLPGSATVVELGVSAPSGMLGDVLELAATGGASYDWDTDGDGEYDITGDVTGTALVDSEALGIIRPRVSARDAGGIAVGSAGVSVVVAGNSRPVASAHADVQHGDSPLGVFFTGNVWDAEDDIADLLISWDTNGDGMYNTGAGWDTLTPPQGYYVTPGIYNAKLRVEDTAGAWDVDTLAILVTGTGPNDSPTAALSANRTACLAPFVISFDAAGSSDPDGSIVWYEWDFNGDGNFEQSGPSSHASNTYPVRGWYVASVRVTDDDGATATAELDITLPGPWSEGGMTANGQRRSPCSGPQTGDLSWSYDAGGSVVSGSPAVGPDGTVYIGSDNNKLVALSGTGNFKWDYTAPSWIESAPAIADDGTIYFGCGDGRLYAISPGGNLLWSYQVSDWITSDPLVGPGGTIYFGSWDTMFYALYPDGELNWRFDTTGKIRDGAALASDGTIYFGCDNNDLYALNPDGSEAWHYEAGGDVNGTPVVGDDGRIFFGSADGNFYAVNPDGTLDWSAPLSTSIAGIALGADGTIYGGGNDNNLYALNPDGSVRWTFPTGGDVLASPVVGSNGTVYVGSLDDFFYAINPDGTELWSYETGSDIRGNAALGADGRVFFGSWDTFVYAIGPST